MNIERGRLRRTQKNTIHNMVNSLYIKEMKMKNQRREKRERKREENKER